MTDDAVAVIEEVVADKGYHSRQTVLDLQTLEIRTYGHSVQDSDLYDGLLGSNSAVSLGF